MANNSKPKHGDGKIYTKKGDAGETSLFGGVRLPKDSTRIAAYGSVDELDAAVGLTRAAATGDIADWLGTIQWHLLEIGSELASPGGENAALTEAAVTELETAIDRWQALLPKLSNFILPGGSELAARLHLARTICRRAERAVVGVARDEAVRPIVVKYLNRLSDALFVAARFANHEAGGEETVWKSTNS